MPINCLMKFSSFTRVPRPSVSSKLLFSPTVMATILPASSKVRTTSMGLSKPSLVAFAVRVSPEATLGSAASSAREARASLIASTTALLEKVAPEIPSTFLPSSKGPVWPINCLMKSSSFTRVPRPSVSPKLLFSPTVMATILPAPSTVTTTSMGLSNPSLVALAVRVSSAESATREAIASLAASTTALLEKVAPEIPSTFLPSSKGPV